MSQEGLRLWKNSWWLFFDKIIRQGLNFLLTAYIARYLGAATFGEWNYAIAFVAIFGFFSTFGLYNILLRDFVRFPDRAGELIGTGLGLRLAGGLITMLVSLTCIFAWKPQASELQLLIFLTAINYLAQSMDVVDYFFQAKLLSVKIATARGISFLIFGGIKLVLIYLRYPVSWFAAAQAGEFMISGIILVISLRNIVPYSSLALNTSLLRQLIRDCLPILFAEIAIIIYMRTDQIMIGEMIGDLALGSYSAAVKISEIWYFIPGIICSTLFPSIIRAHSENPEEYPRRLQKLYDLLSGISISIAIVISFLAPLIISLLFGSEYSEAAPALTVHIWAGVFVFWGFASNQQLVIEGLTRISMYRTIIGMIINIIFNFILIPRLGIIGAALATLLAQAFSAWISSLFFTRCRPIFWMNLRSLSPMRMVTLSRQFIKEGFS